MKNLENLSIRIFADGADRTGMLEMYSRPHISGLTTNPTRMRKAGIRDYRAFCREVLQTITDKPLSIEVCSDDFAEMERQACEIAGWGDNVYVKIPVTDTRRQSSQDLVRRLCARKIKVNVTAVMTLAQVQQVVSALAPDVPSFVSVFAGRIADTGRDPVPLMSSALALLQANPLAELIWASPREVLNIFQAAAMGCHAITVTHDILDRLERVGYDLDDYSLDTVRMFHDDALAAGYRL